MAEGRPDARHQLPCAEGLGEVVIRAHVEGPDLVGFLPPGGDDDDRDTGSIPGAGS